MKNIFLIISIFFFSCEKSENLPAIYNSIEGKWLAQGTIPEGNTKICSIEHPSGQTQVVIKTNQQEIISTAILRTARKLFDGIVFDDIY